MESGDGLLLRVRPRGAVLSSNALGVVATVSERFGNGRIDLTRRANFQIRGVTSPTLGPAQDALAQAGLLDADAGSEAVRNVILSPLAGLDPSAAPAAPAIAEAIETGLSQDPALLALPPKFSFLVDAGGRLPLQGVAADIRVEIDGGGARLAIGGDASGALALAVVPPEAAAETALDLARTFLLLSKDTSARSMRGLLALAGPRAIASCAGLADTLPLARRNAPAPALREAIFGRQPFYFGLGAAFGSFGADQIAALARATSEGVRVTPWRALIVPNPSEDFEAQIATLDLVTRADDPRLAVAACPGHPACLSGEAATRPLAEALARALAFEPGEGIALHVSGCAKGCATSAPAPFTLVGHEGRFDLVLDGGARDPAVLSGLNGAQAESAIALASRRALAS